MLNIEKALASHEKDNRELVGENFFTRYNLAKDRLLKLHYTRTAGGFREGNDHGPQHILRVLGYLDRILGKPGIKLLDPYELFLTAMSVLYHDIGLTHQRKKHAEISAYLLKTEKSGIVFQPHDKEFMTVAITNHSSSQDIKKYCERFDDIEYVGSHKVRIRLVAALVRLADELDEDHYRALEDIREILPLPEGSMFYWVFNQRVQSVVPLRPNKCIQITMSLDNEDHTQTFTVDGQMRSFIELAMEKIIKINKEREYCSGFFPDILKYNKTILRVRPTSKHPEWTSQPITIYDHTSLEELLNLLPQPLRPVSRLVPVAPPASREKGSIPPPKTGLMKRISFDRAHKDLVIYCLSKKKLSKKEQKDLAGEVQHLKNADFEEWLKLELLEGLLLKVFGRDLLADALEASGSNIKQRLS
jgi:hypothetical protein